MTWPTHGGIKIGVERAVREEASQPRARYSIRRGESSAHVPAAVAVADDGVHGIIEPRRSEDRSDRGVHECEVQDGARDVRKQTDRVNLARGGGETVDLPDGHSGQEFGSARDLSAERTQADQEHDPDGSHESLRERRPAYRVRTGGRPALREGEAVRRLTLLVCRDSRSDSGIHDFFRVDATRVFREEAGAFRIAVGGTVEA
jgi:hypothetical protein